MVFVYIRIYYAAKARARRGIRKQPRKPPNEQVRSLEMYIERTKKVMLKEETYLRLYDSHFSMTFCKFILVLGLMKIFKFNEWKTLEILRNFLKKFHPFHSLWLQPSGTPLSVYSAVSKNLINSRWKMSVKWEAVTIHLKGDENFSLSPLHIISLPLFNVSR